MNAALSAHRGEQAASDERRTQHNECRARVERWISLPQNILRAECCTVAALLRSMDDDRRASRRCMCMWSPPPRPGRCILAC